MELNFELPEELRNDSFWSSWADGFNPLPNRIFALVFSGQIDVRDFALIVYLLSFANFSRKHRTSRVQLAKKFNMSRCHLSQRIAHLVKSKILSEEKDGNYSIFSLRIKAKASMELCDEQEDVAQQVHPIGTGGCTQRVQGGVPSGCTIEVSLERTIEITKKEEEEGGLAEKPKTKTASPSPKKSLDLSLTGTDSVPVNGPTPDQVKEAFNNKVKGSGIPAVRILTDKRKGDISKLTRNHFKSLQDWENYFQRAISSRFLTGDNDRSWIADIDFLLKERSVAKILEGSYDRNTKKIALGKNEKYLRGDLF
jgi:hypothetical protein